MSTGDVVKDYNSAARRKNYTLIHIPPIFTVFCVSFLPAMNALAQDGSDGGIESIIVT